MPNVLIEEKNPRVTILTLNRPERRNALTIELLTELTDALDRVAADSQKRVLILRGAGKVFCAGLDLNETTVSERAHRSAEMVAKTLPAISQTRLITIAQVHGAALAGGAGLMSACDFVVAAEDTKIGYPETRRGLEPIRPYGILLVLLLLFFFQPVRDGFSHAIYSILSAFGQPYYGASQGQSLFMFWKSH